VNLIRLTRQTRVAGSLLFMLSILLMPASGVTAAEITGFSFQPLGSQDGGHTGVAAGSNQGKWDFRQRHTSSHTATTLSARHSAGFYARVQWGWTSDFDTTRTLGSQGVITVIAAPNEHWELSIDSSRIWTLGFREEGHDDSYLTVSDVTVSTSGATVQSRSIPTSPLLNK
jgi:hypothetical protein